MKKIYLLLFALMSVLGVNAQTWNFATVSSTDKANLDADVTNWTYDGSNNRWLQQATLHGF